MRDLLQLVSGWFAAIGCVFGLGLVIDFELGYSDHPQLAIVLAVIGVGFLAAFLHLEAAYRAELRRR